MENVFVRYVKKAPPGFHGCTIRNADGSYTICLDPNDSWEQQRESFDHELNHIIRGDFGRDDVQMIEAEAHGEKEKRPL